MSFLRSPSVFFTFGLDSSLTELLRMTPVCSHSDQVTVWFHPVGDTQRQTLSGRESDASDASPAIGFWFLLANRRDAASHQGEMK